MIKLYGIPLSNNVNKVRYCLNYLKLAYELIPVNPLQGENQKPEFTKLSPTAKIPAMEVDGLKLFESNAMIRYLAKREKSAIYPQDPKQAALVDAWLDYPAIHVSGAMGRIIANRVFAPMQGKEVDQKSLAFGLEMMEKYLPILNTQLSKNKFIAGADIYIAVFNLFAVLDPCEMVQVDGSRFKDISRWRNNLKAQDFYQKCFKDYNEFVQSMMAGKTAA